MSVKTVVLHVWMKKEGVIVSWRLCERLGGLARGQNRGGGGDGPRAASLRPTPTSRSPSLPAKVGVWLRDRLLIRLTGEFSRFATLRLLGSLHGGGGGGVLGIVSCAAGLQ